MARIMALDVGLKRTGVAVTDPLNIIASAIETVETEKIVEYLKYYFLSEKVDKLIVGYPTDLQSRETHGTVVVNNIIPLLKETFPELEVIKHDERFTSKIALQSMISGGYSKKDRREKGSLDKMSALIILKSYLGMEY